MALRFGNVDATNIEELLTATAARRDKTVQWKNPRQPILPRFTTGGSVKPDLPAHNHQFSATLGQVALRAGVVAKIRRHDLRRGSAKDIAAAASKGMLPSFLHEEIAAKELLSHDYVTMLKGVTKRYMGPSEHDLWKPRVENKHVDVFTTPMISEVKKPSILTARQLSSAAVDSFCEKYDLDSNKRSQRLKATRMAKNAAHTEWIEEQRSATEPAKKTANGDHGRRFVPATAPAASVIVIDDSDSDSAAEPAKEIANGDCSRQDIPGSSPAAPVIVIEDFDSDDAGGSVSIFSTLMGAEAESDEASSDMAMNTLLECVSGSQMGLEHTTIPPPSQTGQPSLEQFPTLTPLEFVKHFSAVNLTNNMTIAGQGPAGQAASLFEMSGNSRNDATMFRLFCKHRQAKGCMHSTTMPYSLKVHEGRCEKRQPKPPKPLKGPPKKEGPEMSQLLCPVEGCGKSSK